MELPVTGLYAGALTLLFIALSFHVSITRGKTDTSLGDGGNPVMLSAMRRHGNLAEFLPLALLLLALAEMAGTGMIWLHLMGGLLVVGRLIHPLGIAPDGGIFAARVAGSLMTLGALLIGAVALLLAAFG
ncbi:hypothetical protein GQ651_06850 [Alphaproteobacteria bacterium GH1-50]|uniref:Glutathione S-transferase n=1 Tax=Kangsaoukella pontilimi TaxID=2691042 RepID=A0A7C9J2F6_9RHOB|nr:MAPEG family protein [Kangsaoukella pontilimi]MXQ07561.1 hypothetical protein [Kangsaoukella pontilimi]